MGESYHWINKKTGKIALLNESVFYGSILVALSTGIMGFDLGLLSSSGAEVASVLAYTSAVVSSLVMVASGRLLVKYCEFRKVDDEGLSFIDRLRIAYNSGNEETEEQYLLSEIIVDENTCSGSGKEREDSRQKPSGSGSMYGATNNNSIGIS